jgi:predicted small secreted protein
MKKMLGLVLVMVGALVLSGCNTVNGFGQDLQAGGQSIQKAAADDSK